MFSNDSDGCLAKYRYYEEATSGVIFLVIAEISEGLLHRLAKPLLKPLWVKVEEFLVESTNHVLVKLHTFH